jgi:hypothetical protein
MNVDTPEKLTWEQAHIVVSKIKDTNPELFAELVDMKYFSHKHKMKILDNMLMEHPDLYIRYFTQILDR